jgi:predicted ester cyclase
VTVKGLAGIPARPREERMSIENNKAVARQIHDLMDRRDYASIRKLCTQTFTAHIGSQPTMTFDGWEQMGNVFYGAFPNSKWTVEDAVGEGDRVALRCRWGGTHERAFQGIPPTGKKVDIGTMIIYRFENGKVAEHWGEFDALGMMQQIGAVPAPPR